MMEYVYIAGKDTDWYKKCRAYLDSCIEDRKVVANFCQEWNIDVNDYLFGKQQFYVKKKPETKCFSIYAKKNDFVWNDMLFLAIKNNSKLGKAFLKLKLHNADMPPIWWDLFIGFAFEYTQFIFDEKVYLKLDSKNKFPLPEGFTEIKMSEYYTLLEKIDDPKNKLHLEII